jgi:hypothetical protein
MTIYYKFKGTYHLLTLVLAFSFLVTACGQIAQSTLIMTPPPTSAPTTAPVIEIDLEPELPEGDSESGFTAAVRYRCHGCHVDPEYTSFGPRFESSTGIPAIMELGDLRIADSNYKGRASTNREYIIESILLPEAYLVEGDWEGAMPTYFGDMINDQDLADILAWMDTLE